MNINGAKQNKKQKTREKSNKRWTDGETKQILEFLQDHRDFEKPTAQIFYNKFLETAEVDATWLMVKWKVKHLRSNYVKAENWRNSTGAGLLESDEGVNSIEGKLRKMCHYYDELHDVFGKKSSEFSFPTYDTATVCNMDLNSSQLSTENPLGSDYEYCEYEALDNYQETPTFNSELLSVEINEDFVEIPSSTLTPTLQTTNSQVTPPLSQRPSVEESESSSKNKAVQGFAAKMKKSAPKNAIDQLSAIQIERTGYLKLKIEFDKEKFEKEFEFNKRKFEEEVEQKKEEMVLKKLEIEKDERIKILEIEKQERIEKFAIEMKYKYTNS